GDTLKPEARLSFADLGWADDALLSPSHPSASVSVELPQDATQGRSGWYGLRLSYEWHGDLSNDAPVYVYALWNGEAVYQLKLKRDDRFFSGGLEWSMVDLVQGGGGGIDF